MSDSFKIVMGWSRDEGREDGKTRACIGCLLGRLEVLAEVAVLNV